MTKNTKKILVGAAMFGLVGGSTLLTNSNALADHHDGKCKCQNNTCKGKATSCKGFGSDKCKGQNSCKGHGCLKAADKKACDTAKGTWHEDDGHGH